MSVAFFLLFLGAGGCLFLGLIDPVIFDRFTENVSRKKLAKFFGSAMVAFLVLSGITSEGSNEDTQQSVTENNPTEKVEEVAAPELNQEITQPETQVELAVLVLEETEEQIKDEKLYTVTHVVDGDTIKITIDGKSEALRLIGIDTPEVVDPRKQVQCFGREASNKAKEVLLGKKVRLEADSSQGDRDKYDRLLMYVFFEDGTSFNKMMVEEGFAHEYTYNTPYKYQSDYKAAENSARDNKRGFWGDVCGGDTNKSAEQPKANTVSSAIKSFVSGSTTLPSKSSGGFVCNCSKTCPQMSSCSEAQYQLNSCGCSARDADDDGVACDADCQ